MDGISAAASCAGLLALTASATQVGFAYINSCRNFRKEIRNLTNEILQLSGLLSAIHPVINELVAHGQGGPIALAEFSACHATVDEVLELLRRTVPTSKQKLSNRSKILLWHFKTRDFDKLLCRLERHKSNFQLALTASTT